MMGIMKVHSQHTSCLSLEFSFKPNRLSLKWVRSSDLFYLNCFVVLCNNIRTQRSNNSSILLLRLIILLIITFLKLKS